MDRTAVLVVEADLRSLRAAASRLSGDGQAEALVAQCRVLAFSELPGQAIGEGRGCPEPSQEHCLEYAQGAGLSVGPADMPRLVASVVTARARSLAWDRSFVVDSIPRSRTLKEIRHERQQMVRV